MTNGVPSGDPRRWTLAILILVVSSLSAENSETGAYGHYLNQFAVRVKTGLRETIEDVASQHGFVIKRELPNISVFLLEHPNVHHRSKRSAVDHLRLLQEDQRVELAEQEVELRRVKRRVVYGKRFPIRTIEDNSVYKRVEPATLATRDLFYGVSLNYNDPMLKDMWYIHNTGQSGGEKGSDMNIGVVWRNGFTGLGVVVTILDDGIDHTHPDLAPNYDPEASADLNDKSDKKDDPMPDVTDPNNSHGTRCAGEVAAVANNNICGVGIAYNAKIGGVRILDGRVTDSLEAEALNVNFQHIDIYSASWGPMDNGETMEGPRRLSLEAFHRAAKEGRGGLGSIFVWATGNGGHMHDDCSADGYVSLPETLSVGSVNDMGRSPFFMEFCSSTMTVVPSGGSDYIGQEKETGIRKLKVITTDINGGCIENFQGTSSAAPLAAGCIATVLQANPSLSWRDVQHLVVRSSRVPSADNTWTINGAGHHVSPRFGFGLLDCGKMVEHAQNWENVPEQRICNTTKTNYQILKKNGTITDSLHTSGCHEDESLSLDRLEHVQVYVKMSTEVRGDTKFVLTSPAGTRSVLLSPRINDKYSGEWEFTFMTVHSWGENPHGTWVLEIHNVPAPPKANKTSDADKGEKGDNADHVKASYGTDTAGFIKQWSLALHGTHGTRHGRTHVQANWNQRASHPTEEEVMRIKKDELEVSRRVNVKRAQVDDLKRSKVDRLDKNEARDLLVRRLWDELHDHGAKTVRKRVLENPSQDKGYSNKHKRGRSLGQLVDELVVELKRILQKEE